MRRLLFIAAWALLSQTARASDVVVGVSSPTFSKAEVAELSRFLGLSVGSPLDPRAVNEGLKALHGKGRYENVFVDTSPSGGGVAVLIRGSRARVLRQLKFTEVDADVQASVVRGLPLVEGKIIDMRALTEMRDRLREVYQERGYSFAEVNLELKEVEATTQADVEVTVDLGSPTRVTAVRVSGGTPEDNESLGGLVQLKAGDIYTRRTVDEAAERINRYLRANQYPTSKVEQVLTDFTEDRLGVELRFLVKLEDRYLFRFFGNEVFDEVAIRNLLSEEVLSQVDATSKVVELVEARYREVGYHFVKVTAKEETFRSQRLRVVSFHVDEGPKVLVDRVHINGGEGVGESRIVSLFFQGAPGVLSRRVYWEKGMAPAVEALKKSLVEAGYLSVSVGAPRPVFSSDREGVEIFIDVEPGIRTYVGQVDIQGVFHFPQSQILTLLEVAPGDPINRKAVEEGRERVLEAYRQEGYVDAKFVEGEGHEVISLSQNRKEGTVRVHVVEGLQFLVGDITVAGNEKTRDEVILREMKVQPGDRYDPRLVRQSEEDIALLGLFSRVEVLTTNNATYPNRKDIRVVVKENRPGLGEVGFGGQFEDPTLRLRSFFGVTYRNLGGLNQTASVRGEASLPFTADKFIPFVEYAAVLGYRAPYPLGIPVTFATQVGLDGFQISNIGPKIQRRARIETRVEKRVSKPLMLIYRLYRYERTSTEVLPSSETTASLNVDIIGSTGPGVVLDFRNDSFNPTSGSFHTLDVEFAHPALLSGPNTAFTMAVSRNSFFTPIFSPFQLSFFVGVGYAKSMFGGAALPTARLASDLSLGGQASIRGFSIRRFSPSTASTQSAFYNVRAEVGIPLFANITGAIFADSGQIFPDLRTDPRHDGVGFGVRYKTPVGPLVIDIAKGLGPDRESVKFYFTVGTF